MANPVIGSDWELPEFQILVLGCCLLSSWFGFFLVGKHFVDIGDLGTQFLLVGHTGDLRQSQGNCASPTYIRNDIFLSNN